MNCFIYQLITNANYVSKGAFTTSDDLAKEVFDASDVSGEKLWRMPMEESYWESMKSGVADMLNTGGRQGGAITAALFLKQVCA
jgi:leucyl aminopeptidase